MFERVLNMFKIGQNYHFARLLLVMPMIFWAFIHKNQNKIAFYIRVLNRQVVSF